MRFPLRHALLLLALVLPLGVSAQGTDTPGGEPEAEATGPGIRFNGLGRTFIQQTDLGGTLAEADTVTSETRADGEFLLDLAVNAQPNRVTEVQGVIRLRNEFGGFFGSGVTVELRELWARGIIADAVRYRLGDMNLALTPYTVFLPDEDGTVNTPEIFQPQREIIDYEEFYTGRNERRFQGGRVDFGLNFDQVLSAVEVRTFLARLRGTDFSTTPTRLLSGGRVGATSRPIGPFGNQATLGANLAYTWDDLESGDANSGIRNIVYTFDADIRLLDQDGLALHLKGEAGESIAAVRERMEPADAEPTEENLFSDDDTFIEAGLAADLKGAGLNVSAMFVNVGPEFYSAAAQSKRVDYGRALGSFARIGNDRAARRFGLFDLSRDESIYTFRVADELMPYDPRYSNTLPYGRATPNRRGVRVDAAYAPEGGPITAGLEAAFLREIRGQGTEELKDFLLVRAEADVPIGQIASLDRRIGATLGLQVENTSRGGVPVEAVDLTSVLFEAGLSAEVYDRLDVLLGATLRQSSGRDYVPQYIDFNDIRRFPAPFVTDDQESLLGAGIRYRFADQVYLTVQYQSYSYGDDATPEDDYRLGQVFALYSMNF
ncbi:MAG: hypothetical protein AAGI52_18630 [Bacteroidota bacterium]